MVRGFLKTRKICVLKWKWRWWIDLAF